MLAKATGIAVMLLQFCIPVFWWRRARFSLTSHLCSMITVVQMGKHVEQGIYFSWCNCIVFLIQYLLCQKALFLITFFPNVFFLGVEWSGWESAVASQSPSLTFPPLSISRHFVQGEKIKGWDRERVATMARWDGKQVDLPGLLKGQGWLDSPILTFSKCSLLIPKQGYASASALA